MTGVLGALAPLDSLRSLGAGPASAEAQTDAQQRDRDVDMTEVVRALDRIRTEMQQSRQFAEIGAVRDAQKAFLRVNGKMPDFIEVGADIWFGAYDWHVRWQQPLNVGRDTLGRYTVQLMQSLLIMRSEMPGNFIGTPYDEK